MSERQPLGRLVDSLGVEHRPQDGELVLGAVVLLKVMEPDGEVSMRAAWSPGLSWMERVGMHQAAAAADMPERPADVWGADEVVERDVDEDDELR
ncbi:hypothetical protein [Nocardioides sp. GY 10127]|uniref:hypothetical protein n=1 Tax=Nocardioides sp. GY 10127 TaxID=2569762 RepID=UPI0010A7D54A|nr:hypothetical protein [Nocardioides sp. GY 10127]TIC79361.1 hypothetical protein E8D37_17365 [Nocardioides sp. GY 10127]